jgi:hypothetical protein
LSPEPRADEIVPPSISYRYEDLTSEEPDVVDALWQLTQIELVARSLKRELGIWRLLEYCLALKTRLS